MTQPNDRYNTDTSNTPRPEYNGLTPMEWVKLPQEDQKRISREYRETVARENRERVMALQVKLDTERAEKEAAVAAEREKAQRERLEASLHRAYLVEGGDEDGWAKAKTRLVANAVESAAVERAGRDKAAMKARLASKF